MSPRTRNGFFGLGAVIIIILVLILVTLLNRAPDQTAPPSTGPTPPVSESAGSTTSAEPSPASTGEALPMSTVPVGAGSARGTLGPLFTGYDQTQEGAIAAALNYTVAMGSGEMFDDRTRAQVDAYMYVDAAAVEKFGIPTELAAQARQKYGLDARGLPVDKSQKLYSGAYPEYGAFQVRDLKGNTQATIMIWYPTVFGVGQTTADLDVVWTYIQLRMVWSDGDWRIAAHETTPSPPKPRDPSTLWVSFAERSSLLGKGWEIPANGAERPIDRLDLPKS